ncbi:MAG: Asp-tRNA(Asn)/Glu-tRNA(Gln) amidotransferase subunit GatB [Patescibacteria group bacterium]
MNYSPVIGLEIHIQLKTRSKMFCADPNQTEDIPPNTNICEVCTGQPGSLPVANQEAIEKAILMGLALNCEIPEYSKFDRKNYFYPDLPKGYQISQFDRPLCGKGKMELAASDNLSPAEDGGARSLSGESKAEARSARTIRITRAHLEEDAGKLIHPAHAAYSLVDLNRAGVPLLEIVTEPDFKSPAEAKQFLQALRTTARYLGISDADMEKGHLRCDANISLKAVPEGSVPSDLPLPDYKVEIKNMNSFKAVEDALAFEIERQTDELSAGKKLNTETRGWSDAKRSTVSQRIKEGSDDYRYFPEPDLPILHFKPEFVEDLKRKLPELPQPKLQRFLAEYNLSEKIAWQLVEDKDLAEYYEGIVSDLKEWLLAEKIVDPEVLSRTIKEAANWCVGIFTELLNRAGLSPQDSKVTGENFAELLKMIEKNEVSKTAAKQVFAQMFETGDDPSNIVSARGLAQVSDIAALEAAVEKVVSANPKVVADFKAGKKQAVGFLVGKVMAETGGQANPKIVNEILRKKLS